MGGGASRPRGDKLTPNNFEIEAIVGEGGFGKVYSAKRKRLRQETKSQYLSTETRFAIKKMTKRDILKRVGGVEAIFNERAILIELRSPFIVNLWAYFQDSAFCYQVMDFLPGGDLFFHLRARGRFDEAATKFYAASLILAVLSVHQRLILHRDIKPENMILDQTGFIRLGDFGSAVKLQHPLQQVLRRSGTLGYMSPEMLTLLPMHGFPADFYMVGVTIFMLLTGQLPYAQGVPAHVIQYIEAEQAKSADARDDELPATFQTPLPAASFGRSNECVDLLRQMMDPRPWKRLAPRSLSDVEKIPWFADVNFDAILHRDVTSVSPPVTPDPSRMNCALSTAHLDEQLLGETRPKPLDTAQDQRFANYNFNTATSFIATFNQESASFASMSLNDLRQTRSASSSIGGSFKFGASFKVRNTGSFSALVSSKAQSQLPQGIETEATSEQDSARATKAHPSEQTCAESGHVAC